MKIDQVVANNLCVSCGICAAICPQKCISTKNFQPSIDESKCSNCELCSRICPGRQANYENRDEIFLGDILWSLIAQTKDQKILSESTSGGFITTLVKNLLEEQIFDSAFLVDSYDYSEEVFTHRFTQNDSLDQTPKSRYIPVNQKFAVEHAIQNPNEKIILVGTPCFIQGFSKVIDHFKLNRENYLMLGLFCDKTMNHRVQEFFQELTPQPIDKLFFRSKNAGGYPGHVEILFGGGGQTFERKVRMSVKEHFCLERCIYCLDKLNIFADISMGDNYTGQHDSKEGSSCILIRTAIGEKIFAEYQNLFKVWKIEPNEIARSQSIENRKNNFIFSEYKSAEIGYPINIVSPKISCEFHEKISHRREYERLLLQIRMGSKKNFPKVHADLWRMILHK